MKTLLFDYSEFDLLVCTKQRAMYRWILEPAEREALLANIALRNANINYHVIVEISCVSSPDELFILRRAYHNRYKRSLEEDVATNTNGHLRQASHNILPSVLFIKDVLFNKN